MWTVSDYYRVNLHLASSILHLKYCQRHAVHGDVGTNCFVGFFPPFCPCVVEEIGNRIKRVRLGEDGLDSP